MFHSPVIWTAIGILSASWTECSRQRIPADDGRQWQTEWICWAILFTTAQVALFLQSRRTREAAVQEGPAHSSTLTVGHPDVLAVAVANAVAHSLFLYFELHWVLVRPRPGMLMHTLKCVPIARSDGHNVLCHFSL
jgi:hypothetical protein